MQDILDQAPKEEAEDPVGSGIETTIKPLVRQVGAIDDGRHPDHGDHKLWILSQGL